MLSSYADRSCPRFLQTVLEDIRFSWKLLLSNPRFSLLAVLTLALGIAGNATVFSGIDCVLLHPCPGVTDTCGLVLIETVTPQR